MQSILQQLLSLSHSLSTAAGTIQGIELRPLLAALRPEPHPGVAQLAAGSAVDLLAAEPPRFLVVHQRRR